MASAPVTNEGPLFWPTIQVRVRQKTGSPLWIVFYSETECTPLDSFININSEQTIGIQILVLNSFKLIYWVIKQNSEKIIWLINWNLLRSSSNWVDYSAKLKD